MLNRSTVDKSFNRYGNETATFQLMAFIIQQIVTLSKYGHDALDICHP